MAVAVGLWPRPGPAGPAATLARAEQDLARGQPAAARQRLEALLAVDLGTEQRQQARALLERAGYEEARQELAAGRFAEVRRLRRRLAAEGVASARLLNLDLQAERHLPAEVALASVGTLPQYGYELDGSAPRKALPHIDAATKRLEGRWQRAVKDNPRDPTLRVNYGQFLLALADAEAAAEQFEAARRLGGAEAEARLGLGLAAFERGDARRALEQFRASLKADPDNLAALQNAAVCLGRLRRPAEARPYWEKARARAPGELRQRIDKWLARAGADKRGP